MSNINYYILKELLHRNNYYFDEHQLESRLLSHPDFPNINSITDTLDEIDIENLAAEFPDKNPDQIQGSFLALVRQNENDFYVLAKKGKDKKIILFSNEGINHRQEIDENYFSSIWSGVAVLVEYNGTIRKFVNQKKFLLSAVIILLTLCPFLHGLSLFPVIHYFLSLTGALISFFIFLKQAGYHSPLVEKICSESKFTSCNTVLDVKVLKLPLGLNLGDYSLVYFVSIIISIVTIPILEERNYLFGILGILSIPIIITSLTYQIFVIGKYCRMCLLISIILTIQVLIDILFIKDFQSSRLILTFPLTFVILIIGLFFIKKQVAAAIEYRIINISNLKFRRSYEIFLAYHEQQIKMQCTLQVGTEEINLGEKNAKIHLIVVTNPLCESCKDAHIMYEKLLKKYPDQIKVTLRFFVPYENSNDPRTIISEQLLHINEISGPNEVLNEINRLNGQRNPVNTFVNLDNNFRIKHNHALKIQREWCKMNNIQTTPFLIVNERAFPNYFKIEDILNFIDPLIFKVYSVEN